MLTAFFLSSLLRDGSKDKRVFMESRTHQEALTLGQEETVKKVGVAREERAIPVSKAASIQGRAQTSPLPLLGRGNGKQRSKFSVWLPVLLVALILIGVVSWLLFLQLAPSTDPWQSFSDAKLGFSVCYPIDWLVQIDRKQSVVHFHDSTQTSKVDISIFSRTIASDTEQFLQQQALQLDMTGVTTIPSRSFAGTSWQQVQGKLSQEGVNYSVTMLATVYSNRLYLLTQTSPQSTYNDEETLIFSVIRANLHFS